MGGYREPGERRAKGEHSFWKLHEEKAGVAALLGLSVIMWIFTGEDRNKHFHAITAFSSAGSQRAGAPALLHTSPGRVTLS